MEKRNHKPMQREECSPVELEKQNGCLTAIQLAILVVGYGGAFYLHREHQEKAREELQTRYENRITPEDVERLHWFNYNAEGATMSGHPGVCGMLGVETTGYENHVEGKADRRVL